MRCPHCGAEVNESDAFCGECGKPLQREIEIAPSILRKIKIGLTFIWQWRGLIWKWGSMIVSLVFIFSSCASCIDQTYKAEELLMILLIFGFPATIYLMYKERTKKIKYGLAWILFPILTWFSGLPYGHSYRPIEYIDGVLTVSPYTRFTDQTPEAFFIFIILIIPAIVIDVIYVYKTR